MYKFVFLSVFWLLIVQYLLVYLFGEALNVFDKLFVVLAFFAFLKHFKLVNKKSLFIFLLLVFLGLIGNAMFRYQSYPAVLNDLFLYIKSPIGLFLGYYMGRKYGIKFWLIKTIKKYTPIIGIISFLLCIADFALNLFPRIGANQGLMLFYGHNTFMAATLLFHIAVYCTFMKNKSREQLIFVLLSLSVLCTFRMKALLTIAFVVYLYWKFHKKRFVQFTAVDYAIMALGGVYIAMDKFIFYFQENANFARGLIFFNSIQIAQDHFPWGGGIGSFASSGSTKYLSPLYAKYGMYNPLYFFANDSFVATIISQFGFFGLGLFLFLIYQLAKKVFSLRSVTNFFISGATIFVYLIVCAMAEVSFVSVYAVPMMYWIGFLLGCNYLMRRKRRLQQREQYLLRKNAKNIGCNDCVQL